MIDDDVDPDDIYKAMSMNLIETHGLYRVPQMDDPVPPDISDLKPPRDVFYRETSMFASQLPPEVAPRICTCTYLCTGAKATIKCVSCALYDTSGLGYYCDLCFKARHPWYRVPHIYSDIENDESIEHTLRVQHRKAQAERFQQDGQDVLAKLRNQQALLDHVGDDDKVDGEVLETGRTMISLEERIKNFKQMVE